MRLRINLQEAGNSVGKSAAAVPWQKFRAGGSPVAPAAYDVWTQMEEVVVTVSSGMRHYVVVAKILLVT